MDMAKKAKGFVILTIALLLLSYYFFMANSSQTQVLEEVLPTQTNKEKQKKITDAVNEEANYDQPTLESKIVGGSFNVDNTEKVIFNAEIVSASQVSKDQLVIMVDNILQKQRRRAKGSFFTTSGESQAFSGSVPTMVPLSKDDYDHAISLLTDTERSKYGFIFHFNFNVWNQSIEDNDLVHLLNEINLQKDNVALAIIRGHTDAIGTEKVNLEISSKRATYIMKMLSDIKVIIEPVGESEPVSDNSKASGRALNRRAELIFIMKKPDETSVKGAKII